MSEDQIVEQVARLIDPGAWEDPYLGPHGEDFRAGDQAEAIETAQEIVDVLGLHEEHSAEWWRHPTWDGDDGHEPARTRLVTDWQEDTK